MSGYPDMHLTKYSKIPTFPEHMVKMLKPGTKELKV